MKTFRVLCILIITAALLPAFGQEQAPRPTYAQQQASPAPLTPEQQVQALQEQLRTLQKEQQIEALQKQLDAQKKQLERQKTELPSCVPAPPEKPCGWLCREEKRMKAKAEAAAQRQVDKAGR